MYPLGRGAPALDKRHEVMIEWLCTIDHCYARNEVGGDLQFIVMNAIVHAD